MRSELSSDGSTDNAKRREFQVPPFPPPKSHRVDPLQILGNNVTSAAYPLQNFSVLFSHKIPGDEHSELEPIKGENERAARARLNIHAGLAATEWTLIALLTLVPDKRLSVEEACAKMRSLVDHVVSPWCEFYSFATHVGEHGRFDRHYALSLRSRHGFTALAIDLQRVGKKYGMYSIHCKPIEKPRVAVADYMTRQLRSGDAERLAGSGLRLVGYSRRFPKAVTSRYSSNSEFARQHRRTLRLVALGHGIRTEEDYNGVDPTKKRSLNYEAMVRASAWCRGENGFRFRAHCAQQMRKRDHEPPQEGDVDAR